MKLINRQLFLATLGILALSPVHAGTTLTQAWAILPTDGLSHITTGNTERGIAFNPATGHLLLASRTGIAANGFARLLVLNAANGSLLHEMDTTGVGGGNSGVQFNMVGVADDGVVYACNLVTPVSSSPLTDSQRFKIYRWPSEAAGVAPTLVFNSDPSGLNGSEGSNFPNRWGDSFAVRGSGATTQILIGSGSATTQVPTATGVDACVFTSPDGETLVSNFLAGALEIGGSKGIGFGLGNTFYSKASGGTKKIRRASFDAVDQTTAVLNDFTVTPSAGIQIIPFGLDLAAHQWGTFETGGAGPETVKIFDITAADTPPSLLEPAKNLPTDNANANAVGSAAIGGGKLFICDTNNGIVAYNIEVTGAVLPPVIGTSPASRSVYERGRTTFSVTATGTPPLAYQWLKNDVVIDGATSPDYTINPVTAASAGEYKCRVSNADPTPVFSTPAILTVLPSVNTDALTELWHLAPGSRPYITAGTTERGMDYHAATNRVYVASRTPKRIQILSGADGGDLGALLTDAVTNDTGGEAGFDLNMLGVAGDGAIYACNLSNITTGAGFKIYQWPDDAPDTTPGVLYGSRAGEGNPIGSRIGDTMDVRGSGAQTEIVCAARTTNVFVVFTKDNFGFLVPHPITVASLPNSAFGLGVAFGTGNTVWGKRSGDSLYLVSYDLATGTGTILATYGAAVIPSTLGAIGVDPVTGLLAGIHVANSDNVHLYDLPFPFPDPPPASLTLLDQEFYTTDLPNDNGTGSVAVGGGKVFALNTGNGLAAYSATKPVTGTPPVITDVTRSAGSIIFKLKGTVGKTYVIEKSTVLQPAASWTPSGTVTQNAPEEPVTCAIPAGTPRLFIRAREQ